MKLTVQELYYLLEGLNNVLDEKLPVSTAFAIQRNFKRIGEEVNSSNEVKNSLVEKYREHITEDGRILDEDIMGAYQKEYQELMEQEVDLSLIKINLSDLGESIEPRTLGLLETIIKEEE